MEYHVYKDRTGYWRWRLLAGNNRIIADSGEAYVNKRDCHTAIDLVKSSEDALVYEDR